jgi:hypothetical protein
MVGGDVDDPAPALDAEQLVVGVGASPPGGGDGADEGPLLAVPDLDDVVGGVGLHAGALAPERDEIGGGLDRDRPQLADDERRVFRNALVVEKYPRGGVEVVGLAVVDRDEVPVGLGDAVGRAGVEGGELGLGDLADLAVHLAGGGLVEAGLGADFAHGLEHPGDADAGELGGEGGLDPGDGDEGHGGEVVDLLRP